MADQPADVAKSFDPYDVIGIITPGVVVALVLAMGWPALPATLGEKGLSIGDFGLFILVAFVLGNLVQALGNIIEPVIWLFLGLPTNHVRSPTQTLIAPTQREAILKAVAAMEGSSIDIASVDRRTWYSITARAYGRVQAAGRSAKIDIANRTYGLSRGLAAALLGCLVWYLLFHHDQVQVILGLAIALVAAVVRARRAGVHYARSLFLAFIDLPTSPRSSLQKPAPE